MVSTLVVPELGTDFTEDFEDIIIQYLWEKWSINNPDKDTILHTDDPDKIRFKAGFPDTSFPYEICCVQTRTEPIEKVNAKWVFTTKLDILVRMQRLDRTAIETEPQMENMEREVQRIIEHYPPNEIVGIKDLVYDLPSTERVYGSSDTFAKSDWRSITRIKVFYEKEEIIS